MAQQILALAKARPGLSFAEIEREVPGFKGDLALVFGKHDNVVLWTQVSDAGIEALGELLKAAQIEFHPCELLVYLVDGAVPQLPLAKRVKAYAKPHWLPVTVKAL